MLENIVQNNSNHNVGSRLSFFMLGADLVQIGYQSMETIDSIDIKLPKTGTK